MPSPKQKRCLVVFFFLETLTLSFSPFCFLLCLIVSFSHALDQLSLSISCTDKSQICDILVRHHNVLIQLFSLVIFLCTLTWKCTERVFWVSKMNVNLNAGEADRWWQSRTGRDTTVCCLLCSTTLAIKDLTKDIERMCLWQPIKFTLVIRCEILWVHQTAKSCLFMGRWRRTVKKQDSSRNLVIGTKNWPTWTELGTALSSKGKCTAYANLP